MTLINRIINKLKRIYFRMILSEEDYFYYNLFVKNQRWNARTPNDDEQKRWEAISALITEIGHAAGSIRILEIGSGRGWLTNLLSKFGKVRGIEPVAVVVKYARRLFPSLDFFAGSVQGFIQANPSDRFDLIVSSEVIEHVPDPSKDSFVKQLNQLLVTRGYVVITTPRKEIMTSLPYTPDQPVEDWLSESELRDLFTRNNFSVVKSGRITALLNHQQQEVYQVWLFQHNI